jgi:cardiolipin synthase
MNDADTPTSVLASTPTPPRRKRRRLRRAVRIALTLFAVLLLIGWWKVLRIVEHDNWPPPADAVTAAQAREVTEAFANWTDAKRDDVAIDYAPATAADVRIFNGGTEFLPGMLADIESAQHSIHFMMFAFVPGEWGDRYAAALIDRSRAGVEVRVTVDRYGSKVYGKSAAMFREMADAGVEIVVNDIFPLQADGLLPDHDRTWSQDEIGQADHRKMMVIDGVTGWMGGGGIEDHFYTDSFHDLFVRVTGDIVLQMQAVFLTSFHAYGGPLPDTLAIYFPAPTDPGTILVTLLQNIRGGFVPGTEASREAIEQAEERLDILNPYLTDPGILDRVVDAARRGVNVRILVSERSNNTPADAALKYNYDRLLDAGVEIWEYPATMHEKLTIADDITIIGTINYDAWALYRNLEIALRFDDPAIAQMFHDQSITPDLALAHPGERPEGLANTIKGWFWDKLTYFL